MKRTGKRDLTVLSGIDTYRLQNRLFSNSRCDITLLTYYLIERMYEMLDTLLHDSYKISHSSNLILLHAA
jgi:hypothetical protein